MKPRGLAGEWLDEFWHAIREDCSELMREHGDRVKGYHPVVDRVYRSSGDYVVRGQGLGSALILAAYRSCPGLKWRSAVRVATAMELLSKSVLIIDDIIDRDRSRWGHASFHIELGAYAQQQGWRNAQRFGECAGVLGAEILATIGHLALVSAILPKQTFGRVYTIVLGALKALDEMQLADLAFENLLPSSEEWIRMARQRGAAHVSACLQLGATLAGRKSSETRALAEAGVHLGYMYDIRADLLDSYGPPSRRIRRGRDLRMRKKTLFLCAALERAPVRDRRVLIQFLKRNGQIARQTVRQAARWGIPTALNEWAGHGVAARQLVQNCPMTRSSRQFFLEMIDRAGAPMTLRR